MPKNRVHSGKLRAKHTSGTGRRHDKERFSRKTEDEENTVQKQTLKKIEPVKEVELAKKVEPVKEVSDVKPQEVVKVIPPVKESVKSTISDVKQDSVKPILPPVKKEPHKSINPYGKDSPYFKKKSTIKQKPKSVSAYVKPKSGKSISPYSKESPYAQKNYVKSVSPSVTQEPAKSFSEPIKKQEVVKAVSEPIKKQEVVKAVPPSEVKNPVSTKPVADKTRLQNIQTRSKILANLAKKNKNKGAIVVEYQGPRKFNGERSPISAGPSVSEQLAQIRAKKNGPGGCGCQNRA